MSDNHKVKDLSKFLKAMLDYGDGDFDVTFTLKKNGTVHNFSMVAIKPEPEEASTWKGRSLEANVPPKT